MKNQIYFLILFFSIYSTTILQSQNNSLRLYTAYSIGQVDKRMGYLTDQFFGIAVDPYLQNRILNENTPDDEYAFGIGYSYNITRKFAIGLNAGYTLLVQDFIVPVNIYYFSFKGEKMRWRHLSHYHLIQLSPHVQYAIINKEKVKYGINIQFVSNVSLCKELPEFVGASRWKNEYFATELFPGMFMRYKDFQVSIGARAFHLKYRDDAISNNGLNPDSYNPFKVKLSLSYDIFKW